MLRAAHDLLRGLAAAHAAGIVNQDVHAGNLLFAGAGPAMRWKISDFGRACVVGAGRCPHVAGSRALAPEAGHVRKTPASDVDSASSLGPLPTPMLPNAEPATARIASKL